MKILAYNMIPALLIAVAVLLIILDKDGWGWCIVAAVLLAAYPNGDGE